LHRQNSLLLAVLIIFVVAYFTPVPSRATLGSVWDIWKTRGPAPKAKIAAVGNSVVRHVSKCEQDKRSIAEITSDALAQPILDLSYGGQTFLEMINYAAIALKSPQFENVIVFLSLSSLKASNDADLQTLMFFRAAVGPFAANDIPTRLERQWNRRDDGGDPFTYKGTHYPAYEEIKRTFFAFEKASMPCPEQMGQNRAFIEAYYWNALVRLPLLESNISDLKALQQDAEAHGKRVIVVVLPDNLEDIESLDGALAREARSTANASIALMEKAGVHFSRTPEINASQFADRWCACGHLGEQGRQIVATQAALELQRGR
jgi:hypothetical protein